MGLRPPRGPAQEQREAGLVARCTPTDLEAGFASPNRTAHRAMREARSAWPLVPMDQSVLDRAVHVQDRLAEGLLLLLIEEGPKALTEPENYDVRANLMWAATLGLNGLIGAGVPQPTASLLSGHGQDDVRSHI